MSGNLTNLGYSALTKNLYVSNIYNENPNATVKVNLPVAFVDNTIQKILFDTSGNLDTLGAFKLYSGTDLGTVFTSTKRYSIQLNSSNSFEIFDNVANDWRIRINSTTGIVSFNPAIGINTTDTSNNNVNYFPVLVDTSGNQLNLTPYTSSSIKYNPYTSLLTVPNITSSGTHYVGVLEATSGIGILNSAFLELNSSTLKRWLINCTADPTNNLQFAYYNGVFAVTNATLSQTGTFSATNLTATTLISAPTLTASGTVNCAKITQTGTSTSTFAGSIQMVGDLNLNTGGVIYQRDQLLTNFQTYYQTYNGDIYVVKSQISPAVNTAIFYGSPTRFNISGQLNVGTGSPIGGITGATPNVAAFLVAAATSYVSFQMGRSSGGGDSWFWIVFPSGLMSFSSYGYGTTNLLFYAAGDTVQTANSYAVLHVNTSDIRLKEHIEDHTLDDAKEFINKLKPKTYCWKNRNGELDADGNLVGCPTAENCCKKHYGFIAQDIETDFDVANHPIGLHHYQPNEEKTQGLDYCQVVAPLVKVVQDLMLQQQSLIKQNEMLIKRIEMLELK